MKKKIDEQAVDEFIADLYRSAPSVPPERFRDRALERLQSLVPFDAALWGSGTLRNWRFHTVTLVGLPPEYPRALEETRSINPIPPRMLRRLDQPIDMEMVWPDEVFFRSEIYKRCFRRFGISRILATAHADRRSGLMSLLTLYRRSRRAHFAPAERKLQRRATYHLFQAASHVYFLHLSLHVEREPGRVAAVVDREGAFHEVQPQFLDLLERHYPGRDLTALPFALPAPGQFHRESGLSISFEPLGDLTCVLISPEGPLDRLTSREREIVLAVTQGLSFKQAARKIGVAPSTVSNHLYRIYRKLGVHSRTDLADLVYPQK